MSRQASFFRLTSNRACQGFFRPSRRVAGHDRAQSAERHAVARITRGDELPLGRLADERQAVVGLDHLTRPAVVDFGLGHVRREQFFELAEAILGIVLLAGLVVLAAEDDVIVPGVLSTLR